MSAQEPSNSPDAKEGTRAALLSDSSPTTISGSATVWKSSEVEHQLSSGSAAPRDDLVKDPRANGVMRRVELLGHRIDRLGLEATAARCSEAVLRKERIHHVSLNAAKLVRARQDKRLRDILHRADLVNADGQSLVWASRLLGDPLPERVAGIDLMSRLLEVSEAEGFRVYFLGGRPHVLEQALDKLRALHPRLRIAGSHHGYFDAEESADICKAINSTRSDILFVAMSSPQKEYWVADNGSRLEAPLVMGVGGALDVVAGVVARAPRWAQSAGLEWAFRLLQEPRRMWRRYLSTNVRFAAIVSLAVGHRIVRGLWSRARSTLSPARSASEKDRR